MPLQSSKFPARNQTTCSPHWLGRLFTRLLPGVWLGCLALCSPLGAQQSESAGNFYRDLQPIFVKNCITCHGPSKQESKYRIDLAATLLKGGESQKRAIVPGDLAASHLIKRPECHPREPVSILGRSNKSKSGLPLARRSRNRLARRTPLATTGRSNPSHIPSLPNLKTLENAGARTKSTSSCSIASDALDFDPQHLQIELP